jgi:hypothetical protein
MAMKPHNFPLQKHTAQNHNTQYLIPSEALPKMEEQVSVSLMKSRRK